MCIVVIAGYTQNGRIAWERMAANDYRKCSLCHDFTGWASGNFVQTMELTSRPIRHLRFCFELKIPIILRNDWSIYLTIDLADTWFTPITITTASLSECFFLVVSFNFDLCPFNITSFFQSSVWFWTRSPFTFIKSFASTSCNALKQISIYGSIALKFVC